jgi:hypothetical protein
MTDSTPTKEYLEQLSTQIIGLEVEKAAHVLGNMNHRLRRCQRGDKPLVGTCDFDVRRVNVVVDDADIITSVKSFG